VLESLVPEQRPVAEQVLRGGIPAVRTALHLEREKAAAEGRPAPNAEALIGMAEDLLPRLKAAEWRDRAEAAAKVADEIALRDLRSVVAGADVARDEEGRRLAALLREALERRVTTLRDEWLADVRQNLEEGRVVRALRLSGRPPDPASRVPADLASHLADAAGQALAPDTPADRWSALLEAVALSPVRRNVKPVGLPEDAPEDLLQAARQSSGRIPALASLLGIPMPPPPGPLRPVTARPGRGGSRPAKSGRPSSPRPASGQGERRGTTKPGSAERTPAEPDTSPAEPPPDEARAEPTTAAEARPDVTPTPPSQPATQHDPTPAEPPEPTTAAEARPDVAPTPPAQPDVTPTPPTTQHDATPTPPVTEHEPTPEAPLLQAERPAEANPEPEAAANGGDAQPAAAPPRAG
jgi:hypothetical protein